MSHHNPQPYRGARNRSSYFAGMAVSDSPTSTYSVISTSRRSSSSTTSSSSNQSAVRTAAKSIAGVFIACFTPPETGTSSTASYDTRTSSNGKRHSATRGMYMHSHNATGKGESGSIGLTMAHIYDATSNFSPALKIGQGGFGTVYKGTLRDGTVVAIKRAKKSLHDTHLGVEFRSEIKTLSQVKHLNLVRFYGYLEEDDERILVVEYASNGTLRDHLDGVRGNSLDFAARLDIAIDVAHAITYLHNYADHPIIHRDIKSSNILLAENLRAKVADFGFARTGTDTESGVTHVSTQVKGTAGYLDPEYLKTYQLSEKSDVYSFGILLVELVTGRRPIESKRVLKERLTAKWAIKKFTDGDAVSIMDPRLESNAVNDPVIEKILELAFVCIAPSRKNRPSMRRCAEILWGIRKDYKERQPLDVPPSVSSDITLTE